LPAKRGQKVPSLSELFEDEELVRRIKRRLPHLFHLAELESSRAGRIGMKEVLLVMEDM